MQDSKNNEGFEAAFESVSDDNMESFIWTNHTQTGLKEKFIWVLTTAVFILSFCFWKSNLTSHKALIPWRHTWAKFSIMLASNLIQQLHWSFRKENMTNTWFSRQKNRICKKKMHSFPIQHSQGFTATILSGYLSSLLGSFKTKKQSWWRCNHILWKILFFEMFSYERRILW